MKKLIQIIALLSFIACNGSGSGSASKASGVKVVEAEKVISYLVVDEDFIPKIVYTDGTMDNRFWSNPASKRLEREKFLIDATNNGTPVYSIQNYYEHMTDSEIIAEITNHADTTHRCEFSPTGYECYNPLYR